MSITINIFAMAGIVILSLMGGLGIGRSVSRMKADTESRIRDEETEEETGERTGEKIRDGRRAGVKRLSAGCAIGSPVAGTVRPFSEAAGKGAWILPEQGKLYAPVSGKITRLYPMGNTMLLRSESGVELLLRVGETGDELHSVYYRSHVVQNEIVTKGKLLLEFDMEGLRREGIDMAVSVTVRHDDNTREITVTPRAHIKNGEELLWVN